MPRPKITQAAIVRAVKAAQAAGIKVSRFEVEDGKIVVYSSEGARNEPASEFETWRAKRNAREA